MSYKAIFFDRDGTLTMNDRSWTVLRDQKLSEWSGRPFVFSQELFERHFARVRHGGFPFAPYKSVEDELLFFAQWYRSLFSELGITENVEGRVDTLMQHLWYLKKDLYPETIEVLEYFSAHGYKMGVISDTGPSLELTLKNVGIHRYFTSFTASSLVGVGKPDPIIFNAALKAQGVTAAESLYVDDYDVEADGARALGFTSFLIDRAGIVNREWTIHSLMEIVEFVESHDALARG
ncbi:MAG: HAD family hydrolase [Bacillota bacterium]